MEKKHMQTVEINGIKMEIDTRTAKVIESYKVGDPIQVLVKQYGDSYNVYPGIIVAFHNFEMLPTITIVFYEGGYNKAELKTIHLNEKSKDVEIAPAEKLEMSISKGDAIKHFNRAIDTKKAEIKELEAQFSYFSNHFNKHFAEFVSEVVEESSNE